MAEGESVLVGLGSPSQAFFGCAESFARAAGSFADQSGRGFPLADSSIAADAENLRLKYQDLPTKKIISSFKEFFLCNLSG
jgi:hypothetical protein